MTIENRQGWLEEFYPIEADECPRQEATQHSLQKWKGARKESLEKYGLSAIPITFNSNTCALCHFYDKDNEYDACNQCPLAHTDKPCDSSGSAWMKSDRGNNPEPMIEALEKTVLWLKEHKDDLSHP